MRLSHAHFVSEQEIADDDNSEKFESPTVDKKHALTVKGAQLLELVIENADAQAPVEFGEQLLMIE